MERTVLITTEGTYPHYPGGVSVWCDQLVRSLTECKFHILALTHAPGLLPHFELPVSVGSCLTLPLWGTEEPGRGNEDFARQYRRKLATTREVVESGFAPAFGQVAGSLLAGEEADPEVLGKSLHSLYRFFGEFDYAEAMRSRTAWEIFVAACERRLPSEQRPTLAETTTWMRWLTRYLAVLSVRLPRVDLVHASIAGLGGVPGVVAQREWGSAFALSEHGIFLRELYLALGRSKESRRSRWFQMRLNRALVRMNYHHADVITTLGEFNRAWQRRFGADDRKIVPLANGVDPARYFPAPEPPAGPLMVLTMARISPIKGIDTLLKAAGIVKQQTSQVRFRILGDRANAGYFASCQEIIARQGIGDIVEFGVTKDPPSAYRQAHVFCLPSNTEGMPYSVLEAMLSAVPVVATDVGNVAETLQNTGLVVRPNDPQSLAGALLALVDGPSAVHLRRRLGEAGRERALKYYTIEQMVTRCRAIYSALTECDRQLEIA